MTPTLPLEFDITRRTLRTVILVGLALATIVLVIDAFLKSFGGLRAQLLLTLFGITASALIAHLLLGSWRRFPGAAFAALGPLAVSQACYYVLVWTEWRGHEMAWRCWWISMVASVTSSHILALRNARIAWIERVTPYGAALTGLLLMGFGLYPTAPPSASPLHVWLLAPAAALSTIGSLFVWRIRVRRERARQPFTKPAKLTLVFASQVVFFLAGYYVGGAATQPEAPFDALPAALAGKDAREIDVQVRADLANLKTVVAGLDDLSRRAAALQAELRARRQAEGREYYRPEEDDQIRWNFVTYLSYRAVLLRLVATYAGFQAVREPELRARCFLVGYAAGVTAVEAALSLIEHYGRDPVARRKLNEPEPLWGLSAGMLDRVQESVSCETNVEKFREMEEYFKTRREAWRQAGIWEQAEFDWIDARVSVGLAFADSRLVARSKRWFDRVFDQVKKDTYTPMYAAQSMLSTWIGDTTIVKRRPLIEESTIERIESRLRPGDILLERRNWYLSNAFLPGFWPHGALYVGRLDDLRRLGITDQPAVRERLAEYQKPAVDGKPNTVIESISEGVVFNSLTHSMHADYVAVLRPRLSDKQVAEAIVRAFSHQGKPYDFEFDFFTSDKLVCTELVYRSYEGLIHFDLVRVMGRDTLPAIEIVKKFGREQNTPAQQLDFVLFLDGGQEADAAEFCSSADRPRAFNE